MSDTNPRPLPKSQDIANARELLTASLQAVREVRKERNWFLRLYDRWASKRAALKERDRQERIKRACSKGEHVYGTWKPVRSGLIVNENDKCVGYYRDNEAFCIYCRYPVVHRVKWM